MKKTKKILALLLSVVMILSLLPSVVVADGDYGDLTWDFTVENDSLEGIDSLSIIGPGNIAEGWLNFEGDYEIKNAYSSDPSIAAIYAPKESDGWDYDVPDEDAWDELGNLYIKGVSAGNTTIVQEIGAIGSSEVLKTVYLPVTVRNEPYVSATGVTITEGYTRAATVGTTFTLTGVVSPNNATYNTVTWSTDDATVATVSQSGNVVTVTPVAAGTVHITATCDGPNPHSATCTVTVTAPAPAYVAMIGGTQYETLAAAFAAAEDDDTITLLADTSVDNPITVGSITVELDLNGHVVTNNAGAQVRAFELSNDTNFTVTGTKAGSGMVNSAAVDGKTYGFFRIYQKSNATLTVNGGTYIGNTNNGAFVRVSKNSSGSVVNLVNANVTTDWAIFDNTNGGAVALTMTGGTYTQNNVVNGIGNMDGSGKPVGAIHVVSRSTLNMTGVTLNSMGGTGVAVESQSEGTLKNCAITITGTENNWASCAVGIGGLSSVTLDGGTYTSGLHGVSYYTSGGDLIVKGGAVIDGVADGIAYYYDTGYYSNLWKDYFPNGVPFYTTLIDGTIKNGLANYNGGGTNAAKNDSRLTVEGGEIDGDYTVDGTVDVYSITGGTFTYDPTEHVATGYQVTNNCNGTYTVSQLPTYVAQIGETQYETLADAIAEVPTDGTPTTIKLIADETIAGNAGVTIPTNTNVVLDLNGHTLKNGVNTDAASQVITNNGMLTIQDTSELQNGVIMNAIMEGNIHVGEWWSTPQYNYATNVIKNSGTLNVVSGTIRQTAAGSICYAIDNNSTSYDAIVNISGGTITNDYRTVIRMFCNSTAKENEINISGGTVVTTGKAAIWTQLPGSNPASMKKAKLNITGGTITGGEYAWYDYSYGDGWDAVDYSISGGMFTGVLESDGKTRFITGGTFSSEPAAALIAVGYEAVANTPSEGLWTVRAINYVAQIGGTKYLTLAEAIAAATNDQTIKLLTDVTLTGTTELELDKSITLDLAGYTLTAERINLKKGGLTITTSVAGGKVVSSGQAFNVYGSTTDQANYTTLTIDAGVTVEAQYAVCLFPVNNDVKVSYGATININGTLTGSKGTVFVSGNLGDAETPGAALAASDNIPVINVGSTAVITNTGNNDQAIAMNGMAKVVVSEGASVTGREAIGLKRGILIVNGGTFTANGAKKDPAEANLNGTEATGAALSITSTYNYAGMISATIKGGTFTSTNNTAVYVGHANKNNSAVAYDKGVTLAIEDGAFKGAAESGAIYVAPAISGETIPSGFITGGIYSAAPDAAYLANGYVAIDNLDLTTSAAYPYMVAKVESEVNDNTTHTVAVQEVTYGDNQTAMVITEGNTSTVVTFDADIDSTVSGAGSDVDSYINVTQVLANAIEANDVSVDGISSVDVTLSLKQTEVTTAENATIVAAIQNADKAFEIHPEATVTIDNGDTVSYEVSNSELATGAQFTTKLSFGSGAAYKKVTLSHYSTDGELKNTWTATADGNGDVTVTLSSFSYILGSVDNSFTPQTTTGSYGNVNWISKVYLNIQDQIYYTVQIHVNAAELGTGWYVKFCYGDTEYGPFRIDDFVAFSESGMKTTLATGAVYACTTNSTNYYELRHAVYMTQFATKVTVKLYNGNGVEQTLYALTGGSNDSYSYATMNSAGDYQGTTYSYLSELAGRTGWANTANSLIAFGRACDEQKW